MVVLANEYRTVPMNLWLRVLMAVVLVVAPSVLFVLLYRGLMRLQDQELIARLAEAGHLDPASLDGIEGIADGDRSPEAEREQRRAGGLDRNVAVNERRAAYLREHGGPETRSTASHRTGRSRREHPAREVVGAREVLRCPECGAENAAEFGLCWDCLEWLD